MKNVSILLVKFIVSLIAFSIGLDLFFEASFIDIVSFSVLVTIASYLIGDRIVLPRLGTFSAIVIDFFMVYMIVWIFGAILLHSYLQIAWGSVISAGIITIGEVFVHRYLVKFVNSVNTEVRKQPIFNPKLAYGTEFAEEKDPREKG